MSTYRDRVGHTLSFNAPASDQKDASIRPLFNSDLPHYLSHLMRLNRHCRRSRFGTEVKDGFLRDYVGGVNLSNTVVLGFFAGGEMCGAAEIRSLENEWCGRAEVAFSVNEAHQSNGVGTTLMARALAQAQTLGVTQLYLICDRQNGAMRRIAEKAGAEMRFEDSDCICSVPVARRRENALPAAA
jgi:GNAT superfamily N-acetyltransferase